MSIKTEDCKKAIVALVNAPNGATMLAEAYTGVGNIQGFLSQVYLINPRTEDEIQNPTIQDVLRLTSDVKSWKRMAKEQIRPGSYESQMHPGATTMRIFDCRPYEDQLRAYVYDDGNSILSVDICGE